MAKLRAHGSVVGTVEYMIHAKRYMTDGVILKNAGFGWKLAGKVKPDVDPKTACERAAADVAEQLAAKPTVSAYRKALMNLTGLCNRWKLHAAVQLMPDDPGGVWSEACDGYGDNVHADIDEVAQLCVLYRLMKKAREPAAY